MLQMDRPAPDCASRHPGYGRHCEPTGRANPRPMTGSPTSPPSLDDPRAKQSSFVAATKKAGLLRRVAPRNDGERANVTALICPTGKSAANLSSVICKKILLELREHASKPPARKIEFVEPDQADLPSPVPFPKIFRFAVDPNHFYIPRHPVPHRGAFRDRHGRRRRDAVDAASAIDEQRLSGRRSRVVLTPRRWCQVGGVIRR